MKNKVAIVSAAALAFATLPSCTPSGGIDPGFAVLVGEIGDGYTDYRRMEAEQDAADLERIREAQAIRQQQAAAAEAQRQIQMQMQMQPPSPFIYPAPVTNY